MIEKKKIAIIGAKGLPAQDGISRVVEEYITHLVDKYDFTVFCTAHYTSRQSGFYNGYEEVVLSSINNKRLNTLWYYIKAVWIILFRRKFDLVHFHHCDSAFLFPIVKIKYGKRLLVTTHGAFTKLNDKWKKFKFYFYLQYRVFLRSAPFLTAVSKQEAIKTKRYINKDSVYIPNGINADAILADGITVKDYILFAAGRIMALKGLDTMLEALIKAEYKGKVLIAGDITCAPNEFKNKIDALVSKLDVNFLGMIKDKSILFRYIKNSKLFIFPSTAETMSMQLLEVASLKVPVIASDIKENTDIFSENEMTFFKTSNPNDLALKIKNVLSNYQLAQNKAENAYESLLKSFTWSSIAIEYKKIYDLILLENEN